MDSQLVTPLEPEGAYKLGRNGELELARNGGEEWLLVVAVLPHRMVYCL